MFEEDKPASDPAPSTDEAETEKDTSETEKDTSTSTPATSAEIAKSSLVPQDEKLLSALGYISFLCVLPLALRQKSKFCQFHGKQGLVITVIFLLFSWLGWMSVSMTILLGLIQIIIAGLALISAFRGKTWKIPIIAPIARKLDW